jgi:hypothetical protein
MVKQAQPANPPYAWKEISGDIDDEVQSSNQACDLISAQFQASEVDADEFESIYLWFLA